MGSSFTMKKHFDFPWFVILLSLNFPLILFENKPPDGGESKLYPTITPVNSFRVILDYYFQTDFGLLEDRSYYSVEPTRYNFELVEDLYLHCRELIED